jgi:hypothetical protein
VTYVGIEVEDYNSQDVSSAIIVYDRNQIRFLTSSGSTLLYDYVVNQWSTFTNHAGYSSDLCNGTYYYVRTDGKIYKESTTSYLDDTTAYSLLAQTAWMHLGTIQGFQRVRRLISLGDYSNGSSASHLIQVSAAYDFGTVFSTPIQATLGVASASGTFQYRERLPIQKCDTITLLIEEVTTGATGEYLDLTNMSFEAGIKKGLNKLPASRSYG